MSDSDESYKGSTSKGIKLRSRKGFLTWKNRTLAYADAGGFKKFLLTDQNVLSEDEIDTLNVDYINIDPADVRGSKLAKKAWEDEKKKRKSAAKAKSMMTLSCSTNAASRKIGLCASPKAMFDALCEMYGRQNESDLTRLVQDIDDMKMKSMKENPDDFFTEIDELNDLIENIDTNQRKNDRAVAIIIMKNMLDGYESVKSSIQLNKETGDLQAIKEKMQIFWESNFREKRRKKKNHVIDSDNSDSDEDNKEVKTKNKRIWH